jgi:hypothetical protein
MQNFKAPTYLRSASCVWTIIKMTRIWAIVEMGIYSWNYMQKKDGVLYVLYTLKITPLKEW